MSKRERMHRALDAVLNAKAHDEELKVGQRVIIEAGNGGKGGMAGQDFRRLSKDTPGVITDIRGRGQFWVKLEDSPYKWMFQRYAIKGQLDADNAQGRDAGRAPRSYMHEAVNLYHLARTALSGKDDSRWARLNWAANEMHKKYPAVSALAFYVSLSDDWLR